VEGRERPAPMRPRAARGRGESNLSPCSLPLSAEHPVPAHQVAQGSGNDHGDLGCIPHQPSRQEERQQGPGRTPHDGSIDGHTGETQRRESPELAPTASTGSEGPALVPPIAVQVACSVGNTAAEHESYRCGGCPHQEEEVQRQKTDHCIGKSDQPVLADPQYLTGQVSPRDRWKAPSPSGCHSLWWKQPRYLPNILGIDRLIAGRRCHRNRTIDRSDQWSRICVGTEADRS
jgi:hypothetical protein